jgi:hypothetical protein
VNTWGYQDIAIITVCATDSNHNVYICFAAVTAANREVYVTKSIDGGNTWSTPVQVNDVITGMQRMVEMHIDAEDTIHVAWLDARTGEWNVYYSQSRDGGVTFSDDFRITSEGFPLSFTRPGDYFTLCSGPTGILYIVWTDGRKYTDQDIYFTKQEIANPVVTHTPPSSATTNTPISLLVNMKDDDFVDRVELTFHVEGGSEHVVLMNEISDDIYQFTIPLSFVTGDTIFYWFTAFDAASRSSRLPATISGKFEFSITFVPSGLPLVILVGVIVIVIVLVFAIWYLRQPVEVKSSNSKKWYL